jgi:putative NIF3 family GTP cyclohydrolase 1 type 2
MKLAQLVEHLDRAFEIPDWNRDPAMSHWVPEVYRRIGHDCAALFEPDFIARCNGLMFGASDRVTEVYCAAFPAPEILDALEARARSAALLFLHHPVDLESSGAGFLPIPPERLARLRERRISLYACHAPLDCHDELGTSASLAAAFEIREPSAFHTYGRGRAGRIGSLAPTTVAWLAERGKQLLAVEHAEIGGARPETIRRVAFVAGAGDSPEVLAEAETLGAEAFITGDWYTRSKPLGEADRRWVSDNRTACLAYAAKTGMALIGFSHAATEHLVMTRRMKPFFAAHGLPTHCLGQSDWWR